MTKKTKKNEIKTLHVLPTNGLLGLLADVTIVATLISVSLSLVILCVTLAEKITITVGK